MEYKDGRFVVTNKLSLDDRKDIFVNDMLSVAALPKRDTLTFDSSLYPANITTLAGLNKTTTFSSDALIFQPPNPFGITTFTGTTLAPQPTAKPKSIEDVYEDLAEERKLRKELERKVQTLESRVTESETPKQQPPSNEELEQKVKMDAFMEVAEFVVWLKNKVEDKRKAELGMNNSGDSLF